MLFFVRHQLQDRFKVWCRSWSSSSARTATEGKLSLGGLIACVIITGRAVAP
jgi:hypothetical protein